MSKNLAMLNLKQDFLSFKPNFCLAQHIPIFFELAQNEFLQLTILLIIASSSFDRAFCNLAKTL